MRSTMFSIYATLNYLILYRANENIILAVTQHGGHLAYYEGIAADSMW